MTLAQCSNPSRHPETALRDQRLRLTSATPLQNGRPDPTVSNYCYSPITLSAARCLSCLKRLVHQLARTARSLTHTAAPSCTVALFLHEAGLGSWEINPRLDLEHDPICTIQNCISFFLAINHERRCVSAG